MQESIKKEYEWKVFDWNVMNMFLLHIESDWTPLRLFKMSREDYCKVPNDFKWNEEAIKIYTWYEEKDLIEYLYTKWWIDEIIDNVWTYEDVKNYY